MKKKKMDEFEYERQIGDPEVLGADSAIPSGSVPPSAIRESEKGRLRLTTKEEQQVQIVDPYGEEPVAKNEEFVGSIAPEPNISSSRTPLHASPSTTSANIPWMKKNAALIALGTITGGIALTLWLKKKRKKSLTELERYPNDYLGNYGAKSAVTGGHPEEMNGMPADTDLSDPNPVYDGSDLTPV